MNLSKLLLRTKNLSRVSLLACAVFITSSSLAHDPALHGFNLTTFDPPFPAPAFDLAEFHRDGSEGQTSLESLKGSYVLLNFWATWCPPCLAEMPTMEAAFQEFKDKGFKVVAISSDEGGASDIAPFMEKLGVTFTILMDADKKVSSVYGAHNLPLSFILNPDGEVVAGSEGERDWASEEAISVLEEMINSN